MCYRVVTQVTTQRTRAQTGRSDPSDMIEKQHAGFLSQRKCPLCPRYSINIVHVGSIVRLLGRVRAVCLSSIKISTSFSDHSLSANSTLARLRCRIVLI